jgi:hypothetical protein
MDPDAQELKLKYSGGSLAMPLGNMRSLFGDGAVLTLQDGTDYTGTVRAHSRVRVIGGGTSAVTSHSRSYTKWPTSQASNAAAGKVCRMRWEGSDGWWTARYTGAAADLGSFLKAQAAKAVEFVTARGTEYGPFKGANSGD